MAVQRKPESDTPSSRQAIQSWEKVLSAGQLFLKGTCWTTKDSQAPEACSARTGQNPSSSKWKSLDLASPASCRDSCSDFRDIEYDTPFVIGHCFNSGVRTRS